MDTLIYFMFSFAVYIQISESAYSCDQSIPTIAYVTSCPKNKTEWDIAARRKNCESLSAQQSCTSADNFQYHCLENQWQNMTLEMCAPIFYLQGYCAKYSTDKKRVEENYEKGFECLKFDESDKCPSRYPSTDAYKYQRCYKLKQQNPTQTACPICTLPSQSPQFGTTPIVTKEDLGNVNDDPIKTVFLVILALALTGVIVSFIVFYQRKSLNNLRRRLFKEAERSDEEERSTADHGGEGHEESPLIASETVQDQQDMEEVHAVEKGNEVEARHKGQEHEASKSSGDISDSNPEPIKIRSLNSRAGDDVEKLKLHKGTVSKTKADDVPTSYQTPHAVTASKQEPVDDTSLKQTPDKRNASIQDSDNFPTSNSSTDRLMKSKSDDFDDDTSKPRSENMPTETESSILENNTTEDKSGDENEKRFKENPSKSNDDYSLKPLSNEENASKSTSLEAPVLRPVSNCKAAADPVLALHTSSNSGFSFNSSKKETKKVVRDDPPVSKAIPTPAESPESIPIDKSSSSSFDKSSSSLPTKNTSGSKAPDNSVTSFDKISQNRTDASKPISQYPAAAKSTLKDLSASDDAHVSTLSTDDPTSALSNGDPAPKSGKNPFDEDTTPSDPAPDDSTGLELKSGNNPFDEDTPPTDAGGNAAPNDNTASEQNSGTNPSNARTISKFRKLEKAPRPPPHVSKINVRQIASFEKKRAPPPPRLSEQPRTS